MYSNVSHGSIHPVFSSTVLNPLYSIVCNFEYFSRKSVSFLIASKRHGVIVLALGLQFRIFFVKLEVHVPYVEVILWNQDFCELK